MSRVLRIALTIDDPDTLVVPTALSPITKPDWLLVDQAALGVLPALPHRQ